MDCRMRFEFETVLNQARPFDATHSIFGTHMYISLFFSHTYIHTRTVYSMERTKRMETNRFSAMQCKKKIQNLNSNSMNKDGVSKGKDIRIGAIRLILFKSLSVDAFEM